MPKTTIDRVEARFPARFPKKGPYVISVIDAIKCATWGGTEEYRILGEEEWMNAGEFLGRLVSVTVRSL